MSEYVKLANGAGDQFLTALAEGQEAFLKSVTAFTSFAPAPLTPAHRCSPRRERARPFAWILIHS